MNFRPRRQDEPEINLIPFIDVLLVVLIFLMLSTTYSKFTELQLRLPQADADAQRDYPRELIVSVSAEGRFAVNKVPVQGTGGGDQRRCQRHPPICDQCDGGGTTQRAVSGHICNPVAPGQQSLSGPFNLEP